MDMYRKVRLACAEGMSQREAARHFGVSRDSVRKMLAFSVVVSRKWLKLSGGVISGCSETHPTGGCNRQGDHAMTETTDAAMSAPHLGDAGASRAS